MGAQRGIFYSKNTKRNELNYVVDDTKSSSQHWYSKMAKGVYQDEEKCVRRVMHMSITRDNIPGTVVLDKVVENITDAYNDTRFNKQHDERADRTRSILCAPVMGGDGSVLGAMELINKEDNFGIVRAFSKQDEAILCMYASCMQMAMKKTINNDRIQTMSETIARQIAVGRRLNACETAAEAISAFYAVLQQATSASYIAVYTLEQERHEVTRLEVEEDKGRTAIVRNKVPVVENSYVGVSLLFGAVTNIQIEQKEFMGETRYEVADVHIDGDRAWCAGWQSEKHPNAAQMANFTAGVDFAQDRDAYHTMLCIPLFDGQKKQPVGVLQIANKAEMDDAILRKTFERFDADGSGAIDFEELGLAFAALGVEASSEDLVALLSVLDMDIDGNMTVNAEEVEVNFEQFKKMLVEDEELVAPLKVASALEDKVKAGNVRRRSMAMLEGTTTATHASSQEVDLWFEQLQQQRHKLLARFKTKATSTCFTQHDEEVVATLAACGFAVIRNLMHKEEVAALQDSIVELNEISDLTKVATHRSTGIEILQRQDALHQLIDGSGRAAQKLENAALSMLQDPSGVRLSDARYSDALTTLMDMRDPHKMGLDDIQALHNKVQQADDPTVVKCNDRMVEAALVLGAKEPYIEGNLLARRLAELVNAELVSIWTYQMGFGDSKGTLQLVGSHHDTSNSDWLKTCSALEMLYGSHAMGVAGETVHDATLLLKETQTVNPDTPVGVLGNTVVSRRCITCKLFYDEHNQIICDENYYFDSKVDAVPGFKASDLMCIPIMRESRCIGALHFVNRTFRASFTKDCQSIGGFMANLCVTQILDRHFSTMQDGC